MGDLVFLLVSQDVPCNANKAAFSFANHCVLCAFAVFTAKDEKKTQ